MKARIELKDCPFCKGKGRYEFRPNVWMPCKNCRQSGTIEVDVFEPQLIDPTADTSAKGE